MSIHTKIRAGRLALKETEEQLGNRFGVSRATVQQWERENGTMPKLDRITAVADALGLTLDELIANRSLTGDPLPPLILRRFFCCLYAQHSLTELA